MHIITRTGDNWTTGAKKGFRNKGVEYLRASLPMSIYNLGITLSGDKMFWAKNTTSGESYAELWMQHFEKDNGTPEYFTLLSVIPGIDTPKARVEAQQKAIMQEMVWIQTHILNK